MAPILSRDNTVMVGISTINETNPIMERMWGAKDESGRRLMNRFQWRAKCERCSGDDDILICEHQMNDIPPWINLENVRGMYADNPKAFMRELLGMPSKNEGSPFFPLYAIEAFADAPRAIQPIMQRVRQMYLTVDPAQGSATSAFTAVMSAIVCNTIYVSLLRFLAAVAARSPRTGAPHKKNPSWTLTLWRVMLSISRSANGRCSTGKNVCATTSISSSSGRAASTSSPSRISNRRSGR